MHTEAPVDGNKMVVGYRNPVLFILGQLLGDDEYGMGARFIPDHTADPFLALEFASGGVVECTRLFAGV